jgi:choline monooxygenase
VPTRSDAFEPDLSRARTLRSDWYHDPALLEREKRGVFARTWQLVGRANQVRLPGEYFTCSVAGEDLVVTRAGSLHALSAVCRHRAGPVARGSGQRKTLQCAYHGWTYALDGQLQAAPEFEGVQGFDASQVCLPSFRVEEWGGFVFVNLSAAGPGLAGALGEIPAQTRRLPLDRMSLYRRVEYELACNWKTYVDNYLEGYHIPLVHPGLFRELDYSAYRVETYEGYSRQRAPLRPRGEDALFARSVQDGAPAVALYYWVFPNLMLNLYPDNVQVNLVQPLAPERTMTRFEWYVLDPTRAGVAQEFERSFAFAEQVQREDIAICEAVQRGLRSRTYSSGRYSVQRENGVHHFHGLLARYTADGAAG